MGADKNFGSDYHTAAFEKAYYSTATFALTMG